MVDSFPSFDSLNDAQRWVYKQILKTGGYAAPRGYETVETSPLVFRLNNPRARCLSLSGRQWNFPLALGEFCWHLSGSDDLAFISWYASRWVEFSDDNSSLRGSCYGKRIFSLDKNGRSQWDRVKTTLNSDPDSRRAILFFNGPAEDLLDQGKDFPCAVSLQFFIRNGQLDAVASMRSNDAYLGLPYDVFLMTMLQEILADQLNLPLGNYDHIATSMHLYKRHICLVEEIVDSAVHKIDQMPPMGSSRHLAHFLDHESKLRSSFCINDKLSGIDGYWNDLLEVLIWYKSWKKNGVASFDLLDSLVSNQLYRKLLEFSFLKN